jgi:hypothetical protein
MEAPTNGGLPERSSINEHQPVNKPSAISKFKVLYVRLPSLLVQQFMGVFVCH